MSTSVATRLQRYWLRLPQRMRCDRGASTVEWTLVAALLTALFCAVLQVGFALHIRTTLIDAAAEGARIAGLRDATPADAEERTRELIDAAIANNYAGEVHVQVADDIARVTVRAPLPLVGTLGLPDVLEVDAIAPVE
ncbi:TadE/TadG family type IV pilus assembly protein [Gulosibacter bifidus]|uniref:TadE/TadG family type IV pilus assembly protein n=1 Tax=Gulosibacter bifidus TaxID=272239 RepID=A0ABW5RGF5_9MICO|nr:TadE family protein [Gulosibacter bifidus]